MLAEHGYGIMMIDLRMHGESDGDLLPFGGDEYLDIIAAVDYLQTRPDVDSMRISILGLSLGGSESIQICGCWRNTVHNQVVPARGAPMPRKSGVGDGFIDWIIQQ